jgi:hypothetical protein
VQPVILDSATTASMTARPWTHLFFCIKVTSFGYR